MSWNNVLQLKLINMKNLTNKCFTNNKFPQLKLWASN